MTSNPPNSHSTTPPLNPYSNLVAIMARLRGPQGCPWDREQTSETLKPYLLEETYEVLEALDSQDPEALKDELGDLLLQILFHTQITSEAGQFSFEDVAHHLYEKLVHRHPHVFKQDGQQPSLQTSEQVVEQWDQLKLRAPSKGQTPPSILQGIPKTAPALQRAYQVQKRASRVGFDWNTIEPVLEKFKEELQELYREAAQGLTNQKQVGRSPDRQSLIEEELGDVLFSVVNISRFLRTNPEEALRKATNKFIRRFQWMESQAVIQEKPLQDCSPEELDEWWKIAKLETASQILPYTLPKDTPS